MSKSRPIRILIADDEPLARELLRSMLENAADLEVAGEAADGREALERVQGLEPDVLFLDIQMPELDGFEVLKALPRAPVVVFVTAYDHYAVKAFEVHALDYLLKPFDEARLNTTLTRVRQKLHHDERPDVRQVLSLLQTVQKPRYLERIAIHHDERVFLQPVSDIDWFEAEGKHVRLHINRRTELIREGLTSLENSLDPDRFLRISRSAIINIERILELQTWFNGTYLVILKGGDKVSSTRGYREGLQRLLGK